MITIFIIDCFFVWFLSFITFNMTFNFWVVSIFSYFHPGISPSKESRYPFQDPSFLGQLIFMATVLNGIVEWYKYVLNVYRSILYTLIETQVKHTWVKFLYHWRDDCFKPYDLQNLQKRSSFLTLTNHLNWADNQFHLNLHKQNGFTLPTADLQLQAIHYKKQQDDLLDCVLRHRNTIISHVNWPVYFSVTDLRLPLWESLAFQPRGEESLTGQIVLLLGKTTVSFSIL